MDRQMNDLLHSKINEFKSDLRESIKKLLNKSVDYLHLNGNQEFKISNNSLSKREKEQDSLDNCNENSKESFIQNEKLIQTKDNLSKFLNKNSLNNNKLTLDVDNKLQNNLNSNNHNNNHIEFNDECLEFGILSVKNNSEETIKKCPDHIEKSFNEIFSCSNGISVQLSGNIYLQMDQNILNNLDKETSDNDNLFENIDLSQKDIYSTPTSSKKKKYNYKFNLDEFTDLSCINKNNNLSHDELNNKSSIKYENDLDKVETEENTNISTNSNFKLSLLNFIDNSITSSNALNYPNQSILNHYHQNQLATSTDSSLSTLSASSVEIILNNSNNCNKRISNSTNSDTSQRDISQRDILSPPNRKNLKTNTSYYLNQLPLPYLSPTLPQISTNSNNSINKTHLVNSSMLRKMQQQKHQQSNNLDYLNEKTNASSKISSKLFNTEIKNSSDSNFSSKTNKSSSNFNPEIKKVLKNFQKFSTCSLNGPDYYDSLVSFSQNLETYGSKNINATIVASAAAASLNGNPNALHSFDPHYLIEQLTDFQLPRSDKFSDEDDFENNQIDDHDNKKSLNNSIKIENKLDEINDFKIIPPPILMPADSRRSDILNLTLLENEKIACFVVGGEKRLCLPQILTTVLSGFTLNQINVVYDELQIFYSRCTPNQLNILKQANFLPLNVTSCGLITKSDAERLCALLLFYANLVPNSILMKSRQPNQPLTQVLNHIKSDQNLNLELRKSSLILDLIKELPEDIRKAIEEDQPLSTFQISHAIKSTLCIKVEHRCFGKCKGLLILAFYINYTSRCILCLECETLLNPIKFVSHVHKFNENRTCHWGYESINWRSYITLTKDEMDNPKFKLFQKYLKEFKMHEIA